MFTNTFEPVNEPGFQVYALAFPVTDNVIEFPEHTDGLCADAFKVKLVTEMDAVPTLQFT